MGTKGVGLTGTPYLIFFMQIIGAMKADLFLKYMQIFKECGNKFCPRNELNITEEGLLNKM